MSLLLTGEDPHHIQQHDHAFARVDLADSGNELLRASRSDRLRRRSNVLAGEIQHLAHGIDHQSGFDAADIHDHDARAVIRRLDLELEALSSVQDRNYFSAQIRDALDELRRLRHFRDLGEAVDFLDL